MSNGIEVGGAVLVANPKSFLTGRFETRVVSFIFDSQGIDRFKANAVAVDGKAVIVRNGDVFGTALVLFSVVSIFVVAGAGGMSGTLEGTAELLTGAVLVECLAIVVHRESSFTKRNTGR